MAWGQGIVMSLMRVDSVRYGRTVDDDSNVRFFRLVQQMKIEMAAGVNLKQREQKDDEVVHAVEHRKDFALRRIGVEIVP